MLSLLLILSGLGRLTSAGPHLETSLLQITVPRKIETNTSDGEISETHVTYTIQIDRKTYTFHLKKQSFLDPHFLVYAYNKSGTLYPDSSFIKGHCFYQGYATEVPKSAVMLSICSGLRGSLQLENVSYGIEPLESTTVYEHMLYQINNDKIDFSPSKENFLMPHLVQKSYKILVKSKKDSDELLEKILKIQIIMDKALFDYMGSEVAVAAEKVVHIFGLINIMFSQLKVTVKLTSLELWSDQNKISTKGNAEEVLQRFVSWKERFLFQRSHDMAYLLIYRDHPNYVGATYHGMACNPKFAAGIALYPQTITLEAFSVVMTQLLGVSLGLTYNNDIFTCYCPGTTCIMNSKAIRSHGVKFFSSCSMDEFKRMISQPEFECLQNQIVSEVVYQGRYSLCGNGILEPPEQCDCGGTEHCREFQKCCNPADCTLTEFADCGTGPCCDRETCLISVRGTVCRESKDPCDFPEFCDGKSEFCVPDTKSADLEPCNNKTAYCYNGVCQDTDKQCADLFGKFAKGSTFLCTQEVNMQEDDFGNCRRNFCNFKDILCGKIVCHWTRLEIIPFKKFDIQYTYMEGHLCVSAYLRVPTKYVTEDFTYTSNGTMCGPNKYCDTGRCIPRSLYSRRTNCDANINCSGHGVCNNFLHCHCDVGYSPPLCIPSRSSKGGSIDDGFWSKASNEKYLPIKRRPPSRKNNFLFGFYIFLPLLVLTAIIAFKCNKKRFGDREGTATDGFISEDSDSNSTMS
ncbi:disintegrin and metalloproteinase domain-containing protein 18-like [Enhydra lutris kenyoni]|uniref:Disintegrin and metalloproteinase domain-containing protein 18-like n=1 Tax=Enhydra lutris kenyoni TaxID=391180 RepID=A0A2Y9J176_ENHLU|nr:disintegrin and metalloproteinase domain-containing protein 18-like [Enhydra lutris kenyoni]